VLRFVASTWSEQGDGKHLQYLGNASANSPHQTLSMLSIPTANPRFLPKSGGKAHSVMLYFRV